MSHSTWTSVHLAGCEANGTDTLGKVQINTYATAATVPTSLLIASGFVMGYEAHKKSEESWETTKKRKLKLKSNRNKSNRERSSVWGSSTSNLLPFSLF